MSTQSVGASVHCQGPSPHANIHACTSQNPNNPDYNVCSHRHCPQRELLFMMGEFLASVTHLREKPGDEQGEHHNTGLAGVRMLPPQLHIHHLGRHICKGLNNFTQYIIFLQHVPCRKYYMATAQAHVTVCRYGGHAASKHMSIQQNI